MNITGTNVLRISHAAVPPPETTGISANAIAGLILLGLGFLTYAVGQSGLALLIFLAGLVCSLCAMSGGTSAPVIPAVEIDTAQGIVRDMPYGSDASSELYPLQAFAAVVVLRLHDAAGALVWQITLQRRDRGAQIILGQTPDAGRAGVNARYISALTRLPLFMPPGEANAPA